MRIASERDGSDYRSFTFRKKRWSTMKRGHSRRAVDGESEETNLTLNDTCVLFFLVFHVTDTRMKATTIAIQGNMKKK